MTDSMASSAAGVSRRRERQRREREREREREKRESGRERWNHEFVLSKKLVISRRMDRTVA